MHSIALGGYMKRRWHFLYKSEHSTLHLLSGGTDPHFEIAQLPFKKKKQFEIATKVVKWIKPLKLL